MKKFYLFLLIFNSYLLGTVVNTDDYKNINEEGQNINEEHENSINDNEELINIEAINVKEKREKLAKLILVPLLFTSLVNFYFIYDNYKGSQKNTSIIGVIISCLQVLFGAGCYFIVDVPYKILQSLLNGFFYIMFMGNLTYFFARDNFFLNILYASDECNNTFNYIFLYNYFMYIFNSLVSNLRNTKLPYWEVIFVTLVGK